MNLDLAWVKLVGGPLDGHVIRAGYRTEFRAAGYRRSGFCRAYGARLVIARRYVWRPG